MCFEVDSVNGEHIAMNCHDAISQRIIIRCDPVVRWDERDENCELRRLCSVQHHCHDTQLMGGTFRNRNTSARLNVIFTLKLQLQRASRIISDLNLILYLGCVSIYIHCQH